MILLAVDPGSANVGVSVFADQELIYCNRINFSSEAVKFTDRLNDTLESIYLEFLRLANKYEITHVCWEIVPAIGGMNHKDFVVSVSAALKVLAFHHELQYQGIAAITAKKVITSNARAKKEEVRDAVLALYPDLCTQFNVGFKAFDAFDSVAIGLACQQKKQWNLPKTSAYTGSNW